MYKQVPMVARSKGVGLRLLVCWDCGFESRRRHGGLSLVSVVCCHLEVPATGRSFVQWILTDCGVCVTECDQLQR